MASGPLPPGGTTTGLKLFIFGVGLTSAAAAAGGAEVSFLAQVIQVNETGDVSVTIKTDSSVIPAVDAARQFVGLVVTGLAPWRPM